MFNQYYSIRSYRCRLIYYPAQLLVLIHPYRIRPQPTLENQVIALTIKFHPLTLTNCKVERRGQLHSLTHFLPILVDAGIILEALELSLNKNSWPLILDSTFQYAFNDALIVLVFGVGVFDRMKTNSPFSKNVLHGQPSILLIVKLIEHSESFPYRVDWLEIRPLTPKLYIILRGFKSNMTFCI